MSDESTVNSSGFTAGESKVLMSIMKHLEGDLKTDFDAVAQDLGYKDGGVARARWNTIKRKKIQAAAGGVDKASPNKKAGGAKKVAADDEGTPKKRGRKPKAAKSEEVAEDDDEDEGKVKVKDEEEGDEVDEKEVDA